MQSSLLLVCNSHKPRCDLVCKIFLQQKYGSLSPQFLSSATASYRLLPEITIVKPCEDDLAEKLAECFSEGVIKVENKHGM